MKQSSWRTTFISKIFL